MAGALSGLGQPACGTYIHDGLDQGTGGAGEVRQGGGQVLVGGLSFTCFVRRGSANIVIEWCGAVCSCQKADRFDRSLDGGNDRASYPARCHV